MFFSFRYRVACAYSYLSIFVVFIISSSANKFDRSMFARNMITRKRTTKLGRAIMRIDSHEASPRRRASMRRMCGRCVRCTGGFYLHTVFPVCCCANQRGKSPFYKDFCDRDGIISAMYRARSRVTARFTILMRW